MVCYLVIKVCQSRNCRNIFKRACRIEAVLWMHFVRSSFDVSTTNEANVLFNVANPLRCNEHLLIVRWVVVSILHGVDPLPFSFQPVLHDWCNCGMCCPVCGMVHIKEPLLLIGKSSPCGSSRFPLTI